MKIPKDLADEIMRRLDQLEDLDPGHYLSFSDFSQLFSTCNFVIPDELSVPDLIFDLLNAGWIEVKNKENDLHRSEFRITAKGQLRAAASQDYKKFLRNALEVDSLVLDGGTVIPDYEAVSDREGIVVIQASDRIVGLDHNSADYRRISLELVGIRDVLRDANFAGETGQERDRLSDTIDAAIKLWSSSQLKIIQVKVGILMAVEDVGRALEKAGKSVGWALIQDLIKSYVKNKTGIEF